MTKAEEKERIFLKHTSHASYYAYEDIMDAMDEYARQEAIGFHKFYIKGDYPTYSSYEQLYDLYLKSKTKK